MPIIQRLVSLYKLWHETLPHFPKTSRHTLGAKIDLLFVETIELMFIASYLPKEQKSPVLQRARTKFDLLKFFLFVVWEIKALDTKKYAMFSQPLDEVGRMLGGWLRQMEKINPDLQSGKK